MEVTDSTDIETLFKKNYNSLCLSATHYVNDIDVAEDIVMDCFVKYYERRLSKFIIVWAIANYWHLDFLCLEQYAHTEISPLHHNVSTHSQTCPFL